MTTEPHAYEATFGNNRGTQMIRIEADSWQQNDRWLEFMKGGQIVGRVYAPEAWAVKEVGTKG